MGDTPDKKLANGINFGRLGAKTQLNIHESTDKMDMMDMNNSDGFKKHR